MRMYVTVEVLLVTHAPQLTLHLQTEHTDLYVECFIL